VGWEGGAGSSVKGLLWGRDGFLVVVVGSSGLGAELGLVVGLAAPGPVGAGLLFKAFEGVAAALAAFVPHEGLHRDEGGVGFALFFGSVVPRDVVVEGDGLGASGVDPAWAGEFRLGWWIALGRVVWHWGIGSPGVSSSIWIGESDGLIDPERVVGVNVPFK